MPARMMLAAFIIILFSCNAQAEIYRWSDSGGTPAFSDRAPQDRPHRTVSVAQPVSVPMDENIRQSERISQTRERVKHLLSSAPTDNATSETDDAAEAREKACEQYREKLNRLQSRLRAGYKSDKGNTLRQKRREVSEAYSRECILH